MALLEMPQQEGTERRHRLVRGHITAAVKLTNFFMFACTQDFVVKQLQQIPGVTLVEPKGAFYCLPVMASFFGPSASADGFGAIPDADTLCR